VSARSQWFRRSFTTTVQQLIRATYGDRLSLKIVTHVDKMTSSEQIADYLSTVIHYLWPDGTRAKPGPERAEAMQMRTKMVARAKLLGTIPDDLRRIIGTNTTHTGLSQVFDMFQHRKLNKRMVYCFLERLLLTLFPDNQLGDTFKTLRGV
jgi:sorting nexin-13